MNAPFRPPEYPSDALIRREQAKQDEERRRFDESTEALIEHAVIERKKP